MTISQRIFEELKKAHKKQKDLAEYIGISTSAVSDWKKKGTNPAAENISAIADFLGVTTDYLLTGKESSPSIQPTIIQFTNGREQEIMRLFRLLPPSEQDRLIGRAELLVEQVLREENVG